MRKVVSNHIPLKEVKNVQFGLISEKDLVRFK